MQSGCLPISLSFLVFHLFVTHSSICYVQGTCAGLLRDPRMAFLLLLSGKLLLQLQSPTQMAPALRASPILELSEPILPPSSFPYFTSKSQFYLNSHVVNAYPMLEAEDPDDSNKFLRELKT